MPHKRAKYKQVIMIRKDLKLGFGKAVSQACHASIGAMKNANKYAIKKWELEGGKKVVLKVKSLKELRNLHRKAKNAKLPCFLVKNAGLTQLRKGTITCLGIGPAHERKIDKITRGLKLL